MKIKNRLAKILGAFVLVAVLMFCLSLTTVPKDTTSPDLKLWYKQPAAIWEEALPVGNGRLGAMVYGIPQSDTIQFNEDTFWAGGPDTLTKPGTWKALPAIRKLIFDKKFKEADSLTNSTMIGPKLMPFLPMGKLVIAMTGHDKYSNYRRELDLSTAIVKTEYNIAETVVTKEVFASPSSQAIIVHLEAKGTKKLNFSIGFMNQIGATSLAIDQATLKLSGKAPKKKGREGKVKFSSILKVRNLAGSSFVKDSLLVIKDATSVDLILTAATNFKSYKDLSGNAEALAMEYQKNIRATNYKDLKNKHILKHQELFNRIDFKLPKTKNSSLPTDERLEAFQNSADPSLIALYYQFGRYLLISSSRPGNQPANLQGLWNNKLSPPWDSKYTVNINLEMNYWAANTANLQECAEPLYDFISDVAEAGKLTAKHNYNADGWVLHHNTDIWRSTHPIDGAAWGIWPTGGAWLTTHLWEQYAFTLDKDFLAKYYPIIKNSAKFFVETLQEHPDNGWLVTVPTISPENRILSGNISICAGSSIDNQLIRDVFKYCIASSEILKQDASFAATLRSMLPHLAPDQIGKEGYLQEWLEDRDRDIPQLKHRHVSHLYGLFPGNQFTKENTPALWNASKKSLEMRGDGGTGWALAWKINLWARLYDGDHTYKILKNLLKITRAQGHKGAGGTYPNMFDACPPFQIDGNLGALSGITEMLLQSQNEEIHLLPALPKALGTGDIKGLQARGGFAVDVAWNNGSLTAVTVHSKKGQPCKLRMKDQIVEFKTEAGASYTFDNQLKLMK